MIEVKSIEQAEAYVKQARECMTRLRKRAADRQAAAEAAEIEAVPSVYRDRLANILAGLSGIARAANLDSISIQGRRNAAAFLNRTASTLDTLTPTAPVSTWESGLGQIENELVTLLG